MEIKELIEVMNEDKWSAKDKAVFIARFALCQIAGIEQGVLDQRIVSAWFCLIIDRVPPDVTIAFPLIKEIVGDGLVLHYLGTDLSRGTEVIKAFSRAIVEEFSPYELMNNPDPSIRLRLIHLWEREKDHILLKIVPFYYDDAEISIKEALYQAVLTLYKIEAQEDATSVLIRLINLEDDVHIRRWALSRIREIGDDRAIPELQKIKETVCADGALVEPFEEIIKYIRIKSPYKYWYDMFYFN